MFLIIDEFDHLMFFIEGKKWNVLEQGSVHCLKSDVLYLMSFTQHKKR